VVSLALVSKFYCLHALADGNYSPEARKGVYGGKDVKEVGLEPGMKERGSYGW